MIMYRKKNLTIYILKYGSIVKGRKKNIEREENKCLPETHTATEEA